MRLFMETFQGGLQQVVGSVNQLQGGARFAHSFHIATPYYTHVIWKFESYPDYVWFCEKRNIVPHPVEVWFSHQPLNFLGVRS